MKTYLKYFRSVNQRNLLIIFFFIATFGVNVNVKAQSPVLGNDFEKVNNSMKIKMNNHDFDVLIPKVKNSDLITFSESNYNQLVYVTDENPGFYTYTQNKWMKQKVSYVLNSIEMNLQMRAPSLNDLFIEINGDKNSQMLDYNSHMSHLYSGFTFEEGSNQLAILIKK